MATKLYVGGLPYSTHLLSTKLAQWKLDRQEAEAMTEADTAAEADEENISLIFDKRINKKPP